MTETTDKLLIASQTTSPMSLLEMAVKKEADIEKLEKLMALYERWEKEQARKEFLKALGHFQYICPIIPKKDEVKFNGKVQYVFADLATIIITIKEALKESNLSYRWETDDTGDTIKITCVLGHVDGHEERNTLSAKEDASGSKNGIQARGSTRSYLHRYSLIGSLGIGTADTDDDGKSNGKDINELNKTYMDLIAPLLQKDYEKHKGLHPDNWNSELTIDNYVKAIEHVKGLL